MSEINRSLSIPKKTIISCLCCWGIPIFLTFSYIILAAEPDLRLAIPLLTEVTSLQIVLLATVFYLGEKNIIYWQPWFILFFAALFRILFLFKEPQLSDDIYRYIWDGMQSLAGNNPYKLQPAIAPAFTDAMETLRENINHPELVTIYPPASQMIFAIGVLIGKNLLGLKTLMVILDLVTCLLIMRLLSILNIKFYKAVLYAWHPLPVLEIAGSGHIDGIGLLFLFLAVLLLFRQHRSESPAVNITDRDGSYLTRLLSGLLFALSVMIKLFPLVFLPVMMLPGRLRNRAIFLTGFLAGILLLSLFYMPYLKNCFTTLDHYLHNWEFAGFAFRSLRETVKDPEILREFLLTVFCIILALLCFRFYLYCLLHSYISPESESSLLSKLLDTFYMISFSFLLLTTTLHPWYALTLVCFLPFSAGPSGLALSWSVFLGYQVLTPYTILGEWDDNTITAFMIWVAPVATFTLTFIARLTVRPYLFFKHVYQSN